jgi:hypothetical protein
VLVSAEFEAPDTSFAEPEPEPELAEPGFEPVCEADRQFAAGVDLELVTDQLLHLDLPRSAPVAATPPTDGQLFAQASGPATFDAEPQQGAAAAGTDSTIEPGAARPQRRRRRRGGRGRGKPPDLRQGSE